MPGGKGTDALGLRQVLPTQLVIWGGSSPSRMPVPAALHLALSKALSLLQNSLWLGDWEGKSWFTDAFSWYPDTTQNWIIMALHFPFKVGWNDKGNGKSSKWEECQAIYSLLCCLRYVILTIKRIQECWCVVGDKEKNAYYLGNPAGSLLLPPRVVVQEKDIIQQPSTGRIIKSSNLPWINFRSPVSERICPVKVLVKSKGNVEWVVKKEIIIYHIWLCEQLYKWEL